LNLSNIAVSIQHYDESERVIRKAYDTTNRLQDTVFLTSRGVYRLLYNSKKKEAEEFRKWVGDILDDIFFNESKELTKQLKKYELLLEQRDQQLIEQEKNTKEQLQLKDNELVQKDKQKEIEKMELLINSFTPLKI